NADVRAVEHRGTAYRPDESSISLGFLEARVVDGAWRFYLRFWGLPEAQAGPVRESLSNSALTEIPSFIGACLATAPDESVKPTQLHLSFALEDGSIKSTCRVRAVDRYSYPTGEWWADRCDV